MCNACYFHECCAMLCPGTIESSVLARTRTIARAMLGTMLADAADTEAGPYRPHPSKTEASTTCARAGSPHVMLTHVTQCLYARIDRQPMRAPTTCRLRLCA